jgi:tetratricopeptide (TPR) repeat protein
MKKQTYLRLPLVFTTMVVVVIAFNFGYDPGLGWFSYAQEIDQVKEQIFKEAKEALQRARDEGVPLLSPNNFAKANEFYQKALEDYERGERLEKIRENLEQAMEHIDNAFEAAKLSRIGLENLINMREEIRDLGISKYAPGVFSQAEQKFREAAIKVEDGDVNGARSIARDTEKEYRRAAIEALQKGVLTDTREKLKDVKDTIPKESFRRAKTELDETKRFIEAQKSAEFMIGELSNFSRYCGGSR